MSGKIHAVYFSPTHTSRAICRAVANALAARLKLPCQVRDLTLPAMRTNAYHFTKQDVLVLGFPVYAGRIAAPAADMLLRLIGTGTLAVPIAVYGNRAFEDALIEACDLLSAQRFVPIAAGAFLGEHSYSRKVATGRPDAADLKNADVFAAAVAEKLRMGDHRVCTVPGTRPYKETPASTPAAPVTSQACVRCGRCAACCPMGIIRADAPAQAAAGCIKCCACIKSCPQGARRFDDARMQSITAMLEQTCIARKEPEWFL